MIPLWASLLYATVLAVVAFVITLLLNLHERPFLLPMIAVLLSAIQGGFPAGLFAGFVTVLFANYYIVPPRNAFGVPSLEEAYGLVVFAFTAGMISWLASRRRLAEFALEAQALERSMLLARERVARQELEQANRVKDEFLATLSHELRTPLNAVLGWSQILKSRAVDPQQMRHAIDAIHRNAQAQAKLVDDVLDLSRIVTGRMSLAAEHIDLAEVIRNAAESFTPALTAHKQRLELDLTRGLAVIGDEHRLGQVMWNLMSNAVKFTPDGGTIHIRTRSENGTAFVEVQDSGEGIDPALLPHVFERFRQGDSSSTRAHGGLGLGLSLVQYLVAAHGGSVSVHSQGRGTGTLVRVRLPEYRATTADTRVTSRDTDLGGRRVLVIDDHADSRALAQVMLESAGAEVTSCESVRLGLECLEQGPFDVVIADLAIPGEDGYMFIDQMRRAGYRIPAVALTAYSDAEHRDKALAAGFDAFISKPVTTDVLLPLVTSLLGAANRL